MYKSTKFSLDFIVLSAIKSPSDPMNDMILNLAVDDFGLGCDHSVSLVVSARSFRGAEILEREGAFEHTRGAYGPSWQRGGV